MKGSWQLAVGGWRLAVILGITLAVYAQTFHAGFILNYDDGELVVHNLAVREFNLRAIFTEFVYGLYHPFTSTLFALMFRMGGGDPMPFHILNVGLHGLNTVLVFVFIRGLSRNSIAALMVAGLFALHPMHVESVAWVSELKDVLYAAFFLLALIAYLHYVRDLRIKYLALTAILMAASALSKSAAVALPLCLWTIDYYLGRKGSWRLVTEKIPLLAIAVVMGLINMKAQASADFIRDISLHYNYGFIERLLLPIYSLAYYLVSFFFPVSLAAKHFYPHVLTWEYYAAPLVPVAAALVFWKMRGRRKEIAFGLSFFLCSILLMLKIIPTGNDIVSERYTYLPYIGLSFPVALWMAGTAGKISGKTAAILASLLLLILGGWSWRRAGVWTSEETLWSDLIRQHPGEYFGYNLRGQSRYQRGDIREALPDLDRAVQLAPNDPYVHVNRALVYIQGESYEAADKDLTVAIGLLPEYAPAWASRGLARSRDQRAEEAVQDFRKALELGMEDAEMLNNFGIALAQHQEFKEASGILDRAIALDPRRISSYLNRANVRQAMGMAAEALADLDHAIMLDPGNIRALYQRANLKGKVLKDYRAALADYNAVLRLDAAHGRAYMNRGTVYMLQKDMTAACGDWLKAAELQIPGAQQMLERYCVR